MVFQMAPPHITEPNVQSYNLFLTQIHKILYLTFGRIRIINEIF